MKVAFVSTLQPDTNYFRYLALALEERGMDLRVYADRNPKNLEVGLKHVHLLWSPGDRLYPLHILRQALRDRPDLVHLHHEVGMFGGPINASLFPLVPIFLRFFGFKVVTTLHAVVRLKEIDLRFLQTFAWPKVKLLLYLVKTYFFFLNWAIVLFSRKVIVHAEALKKTLTEDYHCPGGRVEVIPHGVPLEVEHPRFLEGSPSWGSYLSLDFILYFGYLHRRKGLEVVLKAFKNVVAAGNPVNLILAGGTLQPGYEKILEHFIENEGLRGRVVLTGFVSQTQLRYLLDHCLFVVLPAIYSISASGPLAQVIAHEKPFLASRAGVYAQEVEEGVGGLLAEPQDEKDWTDKMSLLLGDEKLRERLRGNLAVLHRERIWPKIAERTIALYAQALG